jgi:hypothetical protein
VRYLVRGLRQNRTLERLSLSRNAIHDGGAVALARWLTEDGALQLQELDLSHCHIGDDGMGALYEVLHTDSHASRDRKCLELNLKVHGNGCTLDTRTYQPNVPLRRPLEPYDVLFAPHLARSKQTSRYARYPYLDPLHDVSAWARGHGQEEEEDEKGEGRGERGKEGGRVETFEATTDWRHRAALVVGAQRSSASKPVGQAQREEGNKALALTSRMAMTRGERAW